ncbi:geranylgeranyl reductase family protein [Ferruginibacter albus]|uniref:geranylgeranyl reductase family protein n=1 Tax=Ferruginibacter albus TaxID=2875540 RepID=UPI001CC47B0D|nr:geranylgeranyl reductase family protein [Ferruginibacter albus]UAY50986.1 geranylgeranyl reductase family protein [Ferruginibacter albus]
MKKEKFDVIIVGGGPSGAACAITLAETTKLKIALIDKASFPRDKTCGDALSIDVINQVSWMSPSLAEKFSAHTNKIASYGVKIFSADHSSIAIPLIYKGKKGCGYVFPRMDFDNVLFQHAKEYSNISCFENSEVRSIDKNNDGVLVTTKNEQLEAPVIVGADGAHSIVVKQLSDIEVEKEHYCAGLRIYYEGVTGFNDDNMIELHFFKDVVPGYLWLFPLADNKANVGIGMLSSEVSKRKVNLKETLFDLINNHPDIKERFKNAKALETVKGYGLPLGSKKRNISGERFILTGDAAGLIDPLTGEGIANAIRSGRVAAAHVKNCFAANNFSASFNKAYDKEIYAKMWKEFKISKLLQQLSTYPRLCNQIVRKANTVKYIQGLLIEALASVDKRKSILLNPKFYFKLFFSKNKRTAA